MLNALYDLEENITVFIECQIEIITEIWPYFDIRKSHYCNWIRPWNIFLTGLTRPRSF